MPKYNEIRAGVYNNTLPADSHETALVSVRNNKIITSSLQVSDTFCKRHSDVIRAIQNLITVNANLRSLFHSTTYIDCQKKKQPMYLMNRDGFCLLAMGFNGKQALSFKLAYLNAFNEMEKVISVSQQADFVGREIVKIFEGFSTKMRKQVQEHRAQKYTQYGKYGDITPALHTSNGSKDYNDDISNIIAQLHCFYSEAFSLVEDYYELKKEYNALHLILSKVQNSLLDTSSIINKSIY